MSYRVAFAKWWQWLSPRYRRMGKILKKHVEGKGENFSTGEMMYMDVDEKGRIVRQGKVSELHEGDSK